MWPAPAPNSQRACLEMHCVPPHPAYLGIWLCLVRNSIQPRAEEEFQMEGSACTEKSLNSRDQETGVAKELGVR